MPYRARQFFYALKPHISTADRDLVEAVLGDNLALKERFWAMSANDQQHAIAVLKGVQEIEPSHHDLHQAALLHDMAKSLGQPILHRVLIVLFKRLFPSLLHWLERAPLDSPAWRRPFVVKAQHAEIGAVWAHEAGCSPLTVTLIQYHQHPPTISPQTEFEQLHHILYQIDGKN